ncbi:MAG: MCE family protein, partial [Gemmobacter sp.]
GETFARASRTLGAIEEARATAQRTLAAAEGAFTGAEQVFGAEAPAIAADLRAAVARIDAAVAQIAADLPAVTADLRAAAGQANAAFGDLARIVATAEPPVADFTTRGLSEFTEAAREARTLLATLARLLGLIERDPARFLIERPLPEFRP